MDDSEVDEFFDGVAGRPSPGPAPHPLHDMGATLRAAALRRSAAPVVLSAEELRKRDALMQSLSERGLFGSGEAAQLGRLRGRLSAWFAASAWFRPAAYASMFALCAVLVLQFMPGRETDERLVTRGEAQPTLVSRDPGRAQRDLAMALRAAGASVEVVQINDTMWTLSVDLPPAGAQGGSEVRLKVGTALAKAGMTMPEQTPFSLLVTGPGGG